MDPTSPDQASPPPLVLAPPEKAGAPTPDLLDVLLTVLVSFFSLIFCVTIVLFIAYAAAHGSKDIKNIARNAVLLVPAQTAAYILTVGFMVLLVWARYRTPFLKVVRWNMPTPKLVWA